MKILQINAVYGISSTGRTTKELDEYMISHGIESEIAVTASNCERDGIFIIGNKLDRKKHAFLSRLLGKQGYYSKKPTKELIEFIDRKNPDVIHLRNLHGNYINFPLLMNYIIEKKIPVVLTLHDCWFFTGKCCYYTDDNCDKWQHNCGNCPELQKWNKSWFLDRSSEMLHDKKELFSKVEKLAVVGVSDWITNEAKKSLLKDAWCVKRIYNWIDLNTFVPDNGGTVRKDYNCENDFVVLGVSHTWSKEKGIDIFIQLAKRMPDVKFLMIGNMPEEFELEPNMISTGATSSFKKLSQFYSAADVMLNPSVQETFGKTTAESIASGTPVIGYNVTATPELIGNGCGEIVDLGADISEFEAAINKVRKNGKAYYKDTCVKYAKESFEQEKLINEYIELYKSMLE